MESPSQLGGRYTLIRRLGEGATKDVFLARDETLQRDVALCLFKPHVLSGGYLKRIRREARTLAGLIHPHIVGLYDFREDDGSYLITEYVAGGSLKSKIASDWQDQRNLDEVLRIAAEVADALTETHAQGIFHRDIKPSNVFLAEGGTAKLGDFGMARPHGDESIGEDGLIVGSVPYMSPEQAKGLPPDSPSDMYSFGVMLFEMVAGRRPFHGDDTSVLVHHLNSPAPPLTLYVPSCPPRLEALILRLLDKAPEARPTASEAVNELRRIRDEWSTGGTPVKSDEAAASEPVSTARPGFGGRPLLQAALLVLGLTVALMAWWRPWVSLDPPVPIAQVCDIDKRLTYDISDGPAHADDLSSLYKVSPDNQSIFGHVGRLRELHRDGVDHKGITYIYGAPGVGKTFLVRNHLSGVFPAEASCVVKLSTMAEVAGEAGIQVTDRDDVISLDGRPVFGKLRAISEPSDFRLRRLLAASRCEQNGALRSLIIIDDIDEIHPDSSRLILRSVDNLILDPGQPETGFLHIVVVGGSAGFAPWYRDPKRHGGSARFLNAFELSGPVYSTTGDIEMLATNIFIYLYGKDVWEKMVRDGTASSLIEQYVRYVRRHRFLTYSIRQLTIATMISVRSSTTPDDTEFDLKEFLLNELLRRSSSTHGRPDPADESYRRVLERVASRYASQIDDDGFFVVGLDDRVPVAADGGKTVEVRVRDILDRSGIAITIPESHSTAQYRFEPIWIQAHLIELANQRVAPEHQYRSCSAS